MTKNRHKLIFLVLVIHIVVFSANCGGNGAPVATVGDTAVAKTGLDYAITVDDSPTVAVAGSTFEVTTNNCGARTSAVESFSRSRSFDVVLDAEFSEVVRGQLGGDIIVAGAEIEAAVGVKLGVQVGSTESVSTERQIETPADSLTAVTLRWEEIWQTGRVSINRQDGSVIGDVPFRILTTLRLSQTGILDTPCGTFAPAPVVVDTPEVPATEDKPKATPGTTVVQTEPPTEVPATPLPQPPSATPTTTNTNTPQPLVNEVHTVDAYRTALGQSYSTGIYIQAGDRVHITYLNGQWWIGEGASNGSDCDGFGNSQTPTDAGGYAGRDGERVAAMIGCGNPDICRPLHTAPWGSLLGVVGENGAMFAIGNELDFVVQDSGILYLRINYYNHNAVTGCPYGDGGNVTARVIVTAP